MTEATKPPIRLKMKVGNLEFEIECQECGQRVGLRLHMGWGMFTARWRAGASITTAQQLPMR